MVTWFMGGSGNRRGGRNLQRGDSSRRGGGMRSGDAEDETPFASLDASCAYHDRFGKRHFVMPKYYRDPCGLVEEPSDNQTGYGQNVTLTGPHKENIEWRERLALQDVKSLFSKEANDRSQFVDTPAKLPRRQLRENIRESHAADLLKQDDEVNVKLENAAIEHSKSVDSAVLGKYNLWRKENENENSDSTVRLMQDQIIMARVYISIANMKNKYDLAQELQNRLKESQRALGEVTTDADLPHSAPEKIKTMGQLLSKIRGQLFDCKVVTGKLRAMLQSADEQVRSSKKQSTFLSQLAAKTIPNGVHCLSMRLTIDYYLLPPDKKKFPKSENLENPKLYHYALFSDNVLAASVVVNSTITNAKKQSNANIDNRNQLKTKHRCGSKSLQVRTIANGGQLPELPCVYKSTHFNDVTKQWISPECEENYDNMIKIQAEHCPRPGVVPITPEELSVKVLKPRSRYVKGLGLRRSFSVRTTSASTDNDYVRRLEMEIQEQKEQIQSQKEEIQSHKEEITAQKHEIQVQREEIQAQNKEIGKMNGSIDEHFEITSSIMEFLKKQGFKGQFRG
ncbi:hypothetical protein TEA_003002 [Camellia sinensis var. sinensis]|uniref:Uncharacterized protein n=1 Tax=Camellia sinensis var. sinensis TaxID=542762 RepID=A0A4S4DQH9_CAMSN|nr:hypothetical protein TEA_003002 [Camellia sinensis var. sinensis]